MNYSETRYLLINLETYIGFSLGDLMPNVLKKSTELKKGISIIEKIYVRVFVYFLFMFFIYSVSADDCKGNLSKKRKMLFINSSAYDVDDIKCEDHSLKWFISNNRYRFKTPFRKSILIKKTPYHVEDLKMSRGTYQWHITNTPYLKKTSSRLPASVEKKSKIPSKPTQALSFGFYFGSASIASVDTTIDAKESAVTDLGYGINATWAHLWTDRVSFFAVGSLKKFKFKVANNRSLSKSSVTHRYIGAGVNFKLGNRFSLAPGIGIGESLILNSSGGGNISIDKLSIPVVSLSSKIKLITFKSGFSLDLNVRAGAMLSTSQKGVETKTGHYYNFGVGSSYDLGSKKLFINTGVTNRKLKIGVADQTSKDLGLNVGFGWSF